MSGKLKTLTIYLTGLALLLALPVSAMALCRELHIHLKTLNANDYCLVSGKDSRIVHGWLLEPDRLSAVMITSEDSLVRLTQTLNGPDVIMKLDCFKFDDHSYIEQLTLRTQQNYCGAAAGNIHAKTDKPDFASYTQRKGKVGGRAGSVKWTIGRTS